MMIDMVFLVDFSVADILFLSFLKWKILYKEGVVNAAGGMQLRISCHVPTT